MKAKKINLIIALIAATTSSGIAQFINVPEEFGIAEVTSPGNYGAGCSFVDFDGDGWDDLTMASADGLLFYKNINGEFFESVELEIPEVLPMDYNCIQWLDFDNDNDLDLFLTTQDDGIFLFEQTEFMFFESVAAELGLVNLPVANYGASWGDVNNDGLLDLYLCVYSGFLTVDPNKYNRLYIQQSNGDFLELGESYGVSDGNKPSFQSIFWDEDGDGWQDLLVINDRNMTYNSHYRNVEGNYFEDVGEASGLSVNFSPMSIGICDFDNDQDFDIYMSNTQEGNRFFVKDTDGTYEDHASNFDLEANSICWSTIWVDYNNDGYEDLYVSASPNFTNQGYDFLFRNENGEDFTPIHGQLYNGGSIGGLAAASSDFNKDGFPDIFVVPKEDQAKLFLNTGDTGELNHWLSIELHGVHSNSGAFGSTMEIYCGNDIYSRIHLCGEGFLSQHSNSEHIGIGTHESIDSLIINWPRGLSETYYNLSPDQFLQFYEGSSLQPSFPPIDTTSLCTGINLEFFIGNEYEQVIWSNGFVGDSIQITSPGIYFATAVHESGFTFQTDTLVVNEAQQFEILFNSTSPSCWDSSDGSIEVVESNLDFLELEWLNFGNTSTLTGLESGTYFYQGLDQFGCPFYGSETLNAPAELALDLNAVPILEDEECPFSYTVDLEITGGTPPYNISWELQGDSSGDAFLNENDLSIECIHQGTLNVSITDSLGCTQNVESNYPFLVGITESSNKDFWISTKGKGILHWTGLEGVRTINVYNTSGQFIRKFELPTNPLHLNLPSKGLYIIELSTEDSIKKSKYLME